MTLELWAWANGPEPGHRAQRAESQGWSGVGFGDSQNLQLDAYVALAAAAAATSTLRLATAVTNPVTRHPAVTAGAAASVQALSGGRFTLGIGRGDSALTHLGLGSPNVAAFRQYVETVQQYLRGREVAFGPATEDATSIEALGLANRPKSSRIRWIDQHIPKVPVDIAASGPRMIAMAAAVAEQVTFTLGVATDRLRWAVQIAADTCRQLGRDEKTFRLGVYVPVLVHNDRAVALDAIAGMAASTARFSVMQGKVTVPASEPEAEALRQIHASYDFEQHFTRGSPQSAHLTGELTDDWTIAGPPGYCVERLEEIAALGISKVFVLDGGWGIDVETSRASRRLLCDAVLPHFT